MLMQTIKITIAVAAISLLIFVIIKLITRPRSNIYFEKQNEWLANVFSRYSVTVFGFKGCGKDVLFSHAIHLRGEKHYSNIPYNNNTEVIDINEVNIGKNTFENYINGTVEKVEQRFADGCDIYISDCGIALPCQYNKILNELYPSLPMAVALSRQLWDNRIHFNSQALTRVWDKLREQSDYYVRAVACEDCGDYLVIDTLSYNKYETAEKGLLPFKGSRKERAQFTSTHGEVEQRFVRVYKANIQYDTRYFRQVFLSVPKTLLEEILTA